LYLCQRSFKNYFDFFSGFVPQEVIVDGTNKITNIFKNGHKLLSDDDETSFSTKAIKPLFVLDLLKNNNAEDEDGGFYYSKLPENIVATI
jgi:hypothetical protein